MRIFSPLFSRKAKKPPLPFTDEIHNMLMRDFTEGVILQDYAKAESLESGKLLSKKTPGSLTLSFKDIEKFCELLI